MKKTLLIALALAAHSFASAAPVSYNFDSDGTAWWSAKAGRGGFSAEYTFQIPFADALMSSSLTTSINGQKDIDFSRIWITDGTRTLYEYRQTSTDAQGSEQWSLTGASVQSGITYHLFLEGSSTLPNTVYTGEFSLVRAGSPVQAIPEPASLALALGALGIAGVALRRRAA